MPVNHMPLLQVMHGKLARRWAVDQHTAVVWGLHDVELDLVVCSDILVCGDTEVGCHEAAVFSSLHEQPRAVDYMDVGVWHADLEEGWHVVDIVRYKQHKVGQVCTLVPEEHVSFPQVLLSELVEFLSWVTCFHDPPTDLEQLPVVKIWVRVMVAEIWEGQQALAIPHNLKDLIHHAHWFLVIL